MSLQITLHHQRWYLRLLFFSVIYNQIIVSSAQKYFNSDNFFCFSQFLRTNKGFLKKILLDANSEKENTIIQLFSYNTRYCDDMIVVFKCSQITGDEPMSLWNVFFNVCNVWVCSFCRKILGIYLFYLPGYTTMVAWCCLKLLKVYEGKNGCSQ